MSAAIRDLFSSVPEGPVQHARAELDRRAQLLAAAVRRAFPFMVRRGIPVTPEPAGSSLLEVLEEELGSPRHVIHLATNPGQRRGALYFDAAAMAFILDGVLGGDATAPPALTSDELSGPQRALISRGANACVPAASAVLEAGAGVRLRVVATPEDAPGGGELVTLRFRLGADGSGGSVVLALEYAAFLGATAVPEAARAPDPVVVEALGSVPLELVAELGRVRMTLRELSSLRVGDAITMPVPIDGVVPVRAAGRVLFEGLPTTSGARVAIRVVRGTALDGAPAASERTQARP